MATGSDFTGENPDNPVHPADAVRKKLDALCSIKFQLGAKYQAGMPMQSWDAFKQDNQENLNTAERLYLEIIELCKIELT